MYHLESLSLPEGPDSGSRIEPSEGRECRLDDGELVTRDQAAVERVSGSPRSSSGARGSAAQSSSVRFGVVAGTGPNHCRSLSATSP